MRHALTGPPSMRNGVQWHALRSLAPLFRADRKRVRIDSEPLGRRCIGASSSVLVVQSRTRLNGARYLYWRTLHGSFGFPRRPACHRWGPLGLSIADGRKRKRWSISVGLDRYLSRNLAFHRRERPFVVRQVQGRTAKELAS